MKAGQLGQRVSMERLVKDQYKIGQPCTDWLPILNT